MFAKHNTPLKTALYSLILLFFYILQSVPALGVRFLGCAPELMLILTVCVAFNESETFAAFFGLAAGILNDVVTGDTVGVSAIVFMFAAYIISVLLQTLIRRFFLTYISVILIALFIFLSFQYLANCLFFGYIPLGNALMQVILPKFLFSGVLSYPIYALMNFANHKLAAGGDTE